jgi:hypothetical protein
MYDLTQVAVAEEVARETGTTLQRSEFDLRAVVNEVMTSANYHEATNSLFGHLAYHDMPERSALTVVQEVMKASAGSDMERYQARFDDLERCCTDIYKAEARKRAAIAGDVWSGANIGYEETFVSEPKTIDFIIDGILPATSFGIAGAGGTMKSTTVLRIMIHVILGKAIFGYKVSKPGQCIFVTGEDDVDMIRHRVRQMCDAMKLTESECRKVGHGLIVEDVNGEIARLVEQDSNGNLAFAPTVDAFVTRYQYRNLSIVAFDPLIYFSPGEQYVNDGPGQLMNVARRLSKALGCATGLFTTQARRLPEAELLISMLGAVDQHLLTTHVWLASWRHPRKVRIDRSLRQRWLASWNCFQILMSRCCGCPRCRMPRHLHIQCGSFVTPITPGSLATIWVAKLMPRLRQSECGRKRLSSNTKSSSRYGCIFAMRSLKVAIPPRPRSRGIGKRWASTSVLMRLQTIST